MLEKSTLSDAAYNYLKQSILEFDLQPGEQIPVAKIAQTLGISGTPVREALHRLIKEGLVEQKPYVGYFVRRLSIADVAELFELRKLLECFALERVFANGGFRDVVSQLLSELDNIERQNYPIDQTRTFDINFHIKFLLYRAGGQWLIKIVNNILDLIALTTRMSQNPQAACKEHRAILEAIAEGNVEMAVAALQAHLNRAKLETIALLGKEVSEGGKQVSLESGTKTN
jgi:DNA-binding GntR family transcriptional regulator